MLPALLHEDTYNIAIGGATPIEMYYAVENYIEHNGAPENAVVSIRTVSYVRYRQLGPDALLSIS